MQTYRNPPTAVEMIRRADARYAARQESHFNLPRRIAIALLIVLALVALGLFAGSARADTLVIDHPGWQETYDGSFVELNIGQSSGGLEFQVGSFSTRKTGTGAIPASVIWHIGLWIKGRYVYTQGPCEGYYSLSAHRLSLLCSE